MAQQNLEVLVQQQKNYYDEMRRDIQFIVGDLVFLSIANLRVKHVPAKNCNTNL